MIPNDHTLMLSASNTLHALQEYHRSSGQTIRGVAEVILDDLDLEPSGEPVCVTLSETQARIAVAALIFASQMITAVDEGDAT